MKLKRRIKTTIKYLLCAAVASIVTFVLTLMHFGGSEFFLRFIIKNYYAGEVSQQALDNGAKAGLVASLGDEHSVYIDSEYGYDHFENLISGEYSGVGAVITQQNKKAVITQIYPGSPAEKAGLMLGDIIVEVSGIKSAGSTLTEVSHRLQGKEGTSVSVKVDRGGEILDFELIRAPISVDAVKAEIIDGDTGYISISEFDVNTDEELITALKGMKDVKKLIIDLRDNPGGYMDVAINTVDLFIKEGTIVTAKYNSGESKYTATSKNKTSLSDEFLLETPLIVLVNENSASASEFFSVALKDHGRATIIGTNTYGKGSIQSTFKLKDNSGVKLTVGHFYSPKGTKIDKSGVKPDVEVKLSEEFANVPISEIPREKDAQLKAALDF